MANDSIDDDASERRRPASAREHSLRAELVQVRHELRALLDDLDQLALPVAEPMQSAVVTAVVPRAGGVVLGPRRNDR